MRTTRKLNKSISMSIVLALILCMCVGLLMVCFSNKSNVKAAENATYEFNNSNYQDKYKFYVPEASVPAEDGTTYLGQNVEGTKEYFEGLDFPSKISKKSFLSKTKSENMVILNDQPGTQPIDINSFAISGTDRNQGSFNNNVSNGVLDATTKRDVTSFGTQYGGHYAWKYVYNYVQLPNTIVENGGKVTISAQTIGYHNKLTDAYLRPGHRYLSVTAGIEMYEGNTNNYNLTDMKQNTTSGNSSIAMGAIREDDPAFTEQEVSINILPGEKYLRVSYIYFMATTTNAGGSQSPATLYSKIKDVNITLDSDTPQISNTSYQINDANKAVISADVYDSVGLKSVNISGEGINANMTNSGNKYSYEVSNNGEYTISATDNYDKASDGTNTITVNTIKPTVSDVNVAINSEDNTATITAKVVDHNANGIQSVKIGNENMILGENNIYSIVINKNGKYDITAIDGLDNTVYQSVDVNGLDSAAPEITEIVNDNGVSLTNKIVTFKVTDQNNFDVSVMFGEEVVETTQAYQFVATKPGKYIIKAVDQYGNEATSEVIVKNIISASNGVEISLNETKDILTITMTANANQKIGDQFEFEGALSVEEEYNYGLMAKYKVTLNLELDNSKTIYIPTAQYALNIDGNVTYGDYGKSMHVTIGVKPGQIFVGWFNEDGVLISPNREFDFVLRNNVALTSKFIQKNDANVTVKYYNVAGKQLDIRVYDAQDVTDETEILALINADDVVAPANVHSTFKDWIIKSNDNKGNVSVVSRFSTEKQYNITINYADQTNETKQYYLNEKVTINGKDQTKQGFKVGTTVVSEKDSYSFFVTSDLVIDEITLDEETNNIAIVTEVVDNKVVVSGILNSNVKYQEIGFITIKGDILDEQFIIENKAVSSKKIYSITNNQVIFTVENIDALNVRIYGVTDNGTVEYSDIFTISNPQI